jgi:hypothetical protein
LEKAAAVTTVCKLSRFDEMLLAMPSSALIGRVSDALSRDSDCTSWDVAHSDISNSMTPPIKDFMSAASRGCYDVILSVSIR